MLSTLRPSASVVIAARNASSPTRVVGLSAFGFSVLYLLSDVIEEVQGGFSTGQLWLTLVADAAIPVFVVGLYIVQRPQIGWPGRAGALAYAYAYIFFTGTVVYALVDGSRGYNALVDDLASLNAIHGAIMVLAGLSLGYGVIRASVLPRRTGIVLMVGVVAVAASQGLSAPVQVLAAATRDLAFAGMGAALLATGATSDRRRRVRSAADHPLAS